MSKIRTFWYMIKQGVQNIAKNGFMIFASVSVIFVSLFILGALVLASTNIGNLMQELSDGPSITVNCLPELADEEVDTLYDTLSIDSRVKTITLITKEQNLEKMKEYFSEEEDLFADYTQDDLFVSFEIELNDIYKGTAFIEEIEQMVGVDSVKDTVKVVQFFTTLNNWIRVGTVIAVIGLGILSILLTSNTIKLTVTARKTELEIMKYVGATNAYVRGPFVMEGLFIGLLGSALAYFAVWGVYSYIANYINGANAVKGLITIAAFSNYSVLILMIFLVAAILIGISGSMMAIRKYLKV